ncbi:60S ribosomal protein L34 (nucleomorph) [Lotharella oceanica]|uniref:60S ribosomal protein L34 n=1 Tax=Lotharella oceanica TaxID=641309 RepID=A0A060DBV5_9EUKA|nr:60S ribosomal protein L34 [Lotharella oceanica]
MTRVSKSTRKTYNTKSNKYRNVKVPGNNVRIKKIKKKGRILSKKKCFISQKINRFTSKKKKSLNRPFGDKIHHSVLKKIIILRSFNLKANKKICLFKYNILQTKK